MKQHGLLRLVAPTIYKMINSGKLSYSSVVKHRKGNKVIDTSELIRVFGSLDGVIDDVKSDAESTGINSVGLHDLQHRIALLEAENDGLKGAVRLEMSILIPFVRLCSFWAQARTFFTTPFPVVEILEKILIPPYLVFLSGHPRAFLNLPKNRQIREHSSPRKIPTHHAKLKFCR